jgi:hypothetical protein
MIDLGNGFSMLVHVVLEAITFVGHLNSSQIVAWVMMLSLPSKRFYDAVHVEEKASLLVGTGVSFVCTSANLDLVTLYLRSDRIFTVKWISV